MSNKNAHIRTVGRLPPLNSLRAFEAAARHQSFVQAAQELHVTHSAISRQIRQLEACLGTPLFERRNRAVFLTAHGKHLKTVCTQALADIANAIQVIQAAGAVRPLVLSCETTIAMHWLIPRLARLRQAHPACQVHLVTGGGSVDFAREQIDVALRRNDFTPAENHHVALIGKEWTGPVCAPSHRPLLALAQTPAKLIAPTLLHARTRPYAWQKWLANKDMLMQTEREETFDHFYLSLQAAKASLGLAIGSLYMVEDDLRTGQLVAPYGFTADGSDYVLLSPTPFDENPHLKNFLAWLRTEMAQSTQALEQIRTHQP